MKPDLINCPLCKKRPFASSGTHNILAKKVFRVDCINPLCKNPSTGDTFSLKNAKELWNNKQTTNSMFKEA